MHMDTEQYLLEPKWRVGWGPLHWGLRVGGGTEQLADQVAVGNTPDLSSGSGSSGGVFNSSLAPLVCRWYSNVGSLRNQ